MSKTIDRFFQMRADQKFFDDIDVLRKIQHDLPSRTEMVRRLVRDAVNKKLVVHEKVIEKTS